MSHKISKTSSLGISGNVLSRNCRQFLFINLNSKLSRNHPYISCMKNSMEGTINIHIQSTYTLMSSMVTRNPPPACYILSHRLLCVHAQIMWYWIISILHWNAMVQCYSEHGWNAYRRNKWGISTIWMVCETCVLWTPWDQPEVFWISRCPGQLTCKRIHWGHYQVSRLCRYPSVLINRFHNNKSL